MKRFYKGGLPGESSAAGKCFCLSSPHIKEPKRGKCQSDVAADERKPPNVLSFATALPFVPC